MNHYGITLVAVESEGRGRDDGDWEHDRWTVVLGRDGKLMRLPYKKGLGHHGLEPTLDEMLECLVMDCSTFECDEMDDILGDMPFSKARKLADALETQCKELRRLLGDDYEAFWTQDPED